MSAAVIENHAGTKPAATRLLDLLAGWAEFVAADEQDHVLDTGLSAEEIGALYQAAGEASEGWAQLSADEAEEQVRAFVVGRIVPALFGNRAALAEPPTASLTGQHAGH